jgi:hypothetical protein
MASAPVPAVVPPVPAATTGDTAFFVIFGLFVVAMLVLVVIVITWALRHDIAGRRAWRERQEARVRGETPPHPPEDGS